MNTKESPQIEVTLLFYHYMSGKRGSNPRPPAWEASALPTELLPQYI